MLTEVEKRVLHGLYGDNPRLDRSMSYSAAAINWLGEHDFSHALQWRDGDGRRELNIPDLDSVLESLEHEGRAHAALSHLQGAKLLDYQQRARFDAFEVALTYEGAALARRLHTWQGRLGLRYRENKDGVLGLLITVLVAIITAIATTSIKLELTKPVSASPPAAAPAAPHTPPAPRR